MAHCILAYGNLIDRATVSGGSWVASLPLTNLQDRRLGRVARSSSPAAVHTTWDCAFSSTRPFRTIALVNHNLSLAAQYRVRLSTDPDFLTTTADSGWLDVWPAVYAFGTLPWGSPSWWSGRYSAEEIADFTATLVYVLPRSINAQYIRVELSDETNEAGYVQVGRMFCADGWQPTRNMAYGSSLAWEDPSEVQEALSGAEYFNARSKRRVARFGLESMTEDDAMSRASDIQRRMGITQEVLFAWDADDTVHALRRQFLGRLRTLSPIENPGPDRWRAPFEIKELL